MLTSCAHIVPPCSLPCLLHTPLPFPKKQLAHHSALEELHRHPLWRYGSTAAEWPAPRHASSKPLAPAEAETALLAYVRMAAEAEQQHGLRREGRNAQQLSSADMAAELHALYTLAAIHVAQQQDCQHSAGSQKEGQDSALAEGDFMQLLKAYASLEDRSAPADGSSSSRTGGAAGQQPQRVSEQAWDSRTQAAAAAVEALWAVARLADGPAPQDDEESQQDEGAHEAPGQQQQHRQQGPGQSAPGQLQACSSSKAASSQSARKQVRWAAGQGSNSSSVEESGARSTVGSSSGSDLQVLLQLAQLSLQTAS